MRRFISFFLIIPVTVSHSAHSYTAVTLLTNSCLGIDVTLRMRRAIFQVRNILEERCVLAALGGRLCENESGDCVNKLDESILTRTSVPSVGTEIKFTLQVPCLAVSGEVCISH